MFDIFKTSAAAALAIGLTAGAASAVTVTIGPFIQNTGSGPYSIAQFDATLGTLESVSVSFTASASGFSGFQALNINVFDDVFAGVLSSASGGFGSATASISDTFTVGDSELAQFIGTGNMLGVVSAPTDSSLVTGSFSISYTYDDGIPPAAPIPLPAGAPLLVAGLGGLALLRKKRKN